MYTLALSDARQTQYIIDYKRMQHIWQFKGLDQYLHPTKNLVGYASE